MEIISDELPITAIYSGNKMPTKDVIQKVNNEFINKQSLLSKIYQTAGNITSLSIDAIKNRNYQHLGVLMNISNDLIYNMLNLQNENLIHILTQLKTYSFITGAKISGSGLEIALLH